MQYEITITHKNHNYCIKLNKYKSLGFSYFNKNKRNRSYIHLLIDLFIF
jgi:hypothetical protein